MATLTEIADLAGVPIEGVLRVLNGERVGETIAERVNKAMAAVGPPHPQILEEMNLLAPPLARALGPIRGEVVPADENGEPEASAQAVERIRNQLLDSFTSATAELEATLPQGVGRVVYEAVRVEVQPVSERMSHMAALFDELARVVERLDTRADVERRERLDDLKLLIDLIFTGWQTVDRRLGRIERMLERPRQ